MSRTPVTVLTGYLGTGKTTLLNRILTEEHGKKYAVIVNEFGEIGIDNDLVVDADEEIFEMNNGCICCTVRGDLIRIIATLLRRKRGFDAILVETTGLANPGPVIQTFYMDDAVQAKTRLDAVVTVVDAAHIEKRLNDSPEAMSQIAFADVLLLNKTDLVDAEKLPALEQRIHAINPHCEIHRTEKCTIDLNLILDRRAFDLERITVQDPEFMQVEQDHHHHHEDHHHHHHHHDADEACDDPICNLHDVKHDDEITSVGMRTDKPLQAEKLFTWLQTLLADKGQDLLRTKGILVIDGDPRKLVVQGVHMMLDVDYVSEWKEGELKESRLVFIGREMDKEFLHKGFELCIA
ncbi:MAG: GTP-binding protein [Magnetococcales bacterium]|nr:GTP-binding protein [Magnetococcales bacterium]